MKIAVVILNWNGRDLLKKFLPSLVQFSNHKGVSLYVADNASSDDSVEFLESEFPQISIVKNVKNEGFAGGYNRALQKIEADVYALLNSDIEVTENWLNPIIEELENNPNTAAVQPKILDFNNKNNFEYAGAAGGYVDKYGYPYCRGRLFNTLEKDDSQFDDTKEIFWASGACLVIRAAVFKQVGGFDEDYFAHQEEIDLCWRIKNLNFDIKYIGNSSVYHIGGATLKEESPRKTFLNFRNSLFSLAKNVPKNQVLFIILSRLLLDGIAGMKFLIELRPAHTIAIVKSHFSFYSYYKKMIKKRGQHQRSDYYTVKSIVWRYFCLGRKKYKDL